LAEYVAAFRVTHEHVPRAGVLRHWRRGLAGKRAPVFGPNVLHARDEVATRPECVPHARERDRGGEKNHRSIITWARARDERRHELSCLRWPEVHLPIRGEYRTS